MDLSYLLSTKGIDTKQFSGPGDASCPEGALIASSARVAVEIRRQELRPGTNGILALNNETSAPDRKTALPSVDSALIANWGIRRRRLPA